MPISPPTVLVAVAPAFTAAVDQTARSSPVLRPASPPTVDVAPVTVTVPPST